MKDDLMMAGHADKAEEEEGAEGDEDDGDDDHPGEIIEADETADAPIVIAKDVCSPSHEEREKHNATHLPYRSWCHICVQARGREDDHKRNKEKQVEAVPTVVMDYKAFGQDEEDESLTSIVMRDKRTTCTAAHIAECKGTGDQWIVNKLVSDIDDWGYTDLILKCDGEPALIQVAEAMKKRRKHPTIIQHSPAYDPAANGVAEHAVQDFMGQMRACKLGLEQRTKTKVETDWRILEWMAEHAAATIGRCMVGHDGKTPIWRLMGKPSSKPILEFGERVLAKPLRASQTRRKLSLRSKWVFGTWVGMASRTNEHLVALDDGGAVVRVRTVKRRPMEERWSGEAISKIVASPRAPNPKDKSQAEPMPERLTKGADPGGGSGVELPDAKTFDAEEKVRDFKITKSLIEKFGGTENCKGCEGHVMGSRRAHSEACRARFENAMKADDLLGGRIKERDTRKKLKEEPDASMGGQIDAEPPMPEETTAQETPGKRAKDIFDEDDSDLEEPEVIEPDEEMDEPRSTAASSRPQESGETPQAKRRRVLHAISELTKMIEESKDRKKCDEKRGRICNVTRWVSEVIGQVEARPSPHDEEASHWKEMYDGMEFLDDVNGYVQLEKDLVVAARKLEIDYFRKMGVYTKVSRTEATNGKFKVISTKWIDTNKGDTKNPNYRSRLVGREIKKDKRLDLFAATPPLETIKFLLARAAQEQKRNNPWRIGTIDVRRAYFYAPSRRPVYVEIPKEDRQPGDENMVGKLQLSLYGTRDAAMNWAMEYTEHLGKLGFVQGVSSPCNFAHKAMELSVTVHGDDFVVAGPLASIKWMNVHMRAKYEIKTEIIGPEKECAKELKILGRIMRWTDHGFEYEPDQRHAEMIVKELGLCSARVVATPGTKDERQHDLVDAVEDEYDKELEMDRIAATKYRGLAARLNFLAMDRSDLQYAAKECCKKMSTPLVGDWERLKRVGRYLRGHARLVQSFPFEERSRTMDGYGDSDWAGDKVKCKSTSGGAIFLGKSMLKSWSSTQTIIALSSGEAELYALMKVAVQVLGTIAMASDFDFVCSGKVRTDSTAAIGIVSRTGLGGRSRHVRVQYLWIQEAVKRGEFALEKVLTDYNVADLMTKYLPKDPFMRHLVTMGFEFKEGTSEKARAINGLEWYNKPWGGVRIEHYNGKTGKHTRTSTISISITERV